MCNSCAGINLLIKINKTSPASVAARQGGFIDPVRCVQTSLVKPAPTQSKTLALPLLKDMILQQIAFCVRYSPLAKECNSGTVRGCRYCIQSAVPHTAAIRCR